MSRIEKALEKAVKLRDSRPAVEPPKPEAASNRQPLERKAVPGGRVEVRIDSPYIVTLNDPESPISEEYRKLKAMVVKLTKQGGFQNTIMVTSSLGLEGKSITAINFAITLSREYDHTVLLMDADLRKPSLHRYFNIAPGAGLSDCIVDGLGVGEVIARTGMGKLSLLPAGRKVADPAELLSSRRMKDIIFELKHRYADRYVVIDTPPILSFAETHSISSIVDGVVLVVREGTASLQSINEALDILRHGKVLGIVYNNAAIDDIAGRNNARHYFSAHKETARSD